MKVTVTHYTKSVIASIKVDGDPATKSYDLDENAKGFSLRLIRLIELGANITIITEEFKP